MKTICSSLDYQDDKLLVKDTVRFENVVSIYQEGILLMQKMNKVIVDFCSLQQCDSSILALCCEWVKNATEQKKEILLLNLPHFMQDLIKVHGLNNILQGNVV